LARLYPLDRQTMPDTAASIRSSEFSIFHVRIMIETDPMLIVGICFLIVFLLRDAQLLSGSQSSSRSLLHVYCLVVLGCIIFAGGLLAANSADILEMLKSTWIWTISVGLHLAGFALCLWLRRARLLSWAWLVALFPSPMLTLLLLGIRAELPSSLFGGEIGAAVFVAFAWTAVVAGTGEILTRIGGNDSEFAVDFAAVSNTTAIALLPFSPFF
jgi:hypothetical protein